MAYQIKHIKKDRAYITKMVTLVTFGYFYFFKYPVFILFINYYYSSIN